MTVNSGRPDERQRLGKRLHRGSREHIGGNFDDTGVADAADVKHFAGGCFQHGPRVFERSLAAADVVNELPVLGRHFAAGERRVEIARSLAFDDRRRLARSRGRNGGVCGDQMARGKGGSDRAHHFQQCRVVADENLDDITQIGHLDH